MSGCSFRDVVGETPEAAWLMRAANHVMHSPGTVDLAPSYYYEGRMFYTPRGDVNNILFTKLNFYIHDQSNLTGDKR